MASGRLTSSPESTPVFVSPQGAGNQGSSWIHLHLSGDFGGGTFQLFFNTETEGAVPIANASFTEAADKWIQIKPGTEVYGQLTGAVAPDLIFSLR